MIKKLIVIITLCTAVLTGCTKRENPIGFNETNVNPIQTVITKLESYKSFFAINDSTGNYTNNPKLLIGEKNNIKFMTMAKFYDFPESDTCSNSMIKFKVSYKDSVGSDSVNIKMGILKQDWLENQITWKYAKKDSVWSNPDHNYDAVFEFKHNMSKDSLYINLPDTIVQNWIDKPDDNHGFVLFTDETDRFIELRSSETSDRAKLTYNAKGDTSLYVKDLLVDGFIYKATGIDTNKTDDIIISNLLPRRSVINIDLSIDALNKSLSDSTSITAFADTNQLKMTTINRAKLILNIDKANSFIYSNHLFIYATLVRYENTHYPISLEDALVFSNTLPLPLEKDKDTYWMNLTPYVQAITSGRYKNYGIMIKTNKEHMDLNQVKFKDDIKLEIIYTKPFIED